MLITKKIKAFTVFELLITMTLTGILVAFAFTSFNMMQQLFNDYSKQSNFISEINQLHSALFYISHKSTAIIKEDDKHLVFKSDTANTQLILNEKNILLVFNSHTDTFHLEPKDVSIKLVNATNEVPNSLINMFDATVLFHTQKFHVSFTKEYDAQSVLKSLLVALPLNSE